MPITSVAGQVSSNQLAIDISGINNTGSSLHMVNMLFGISVGTVNLPGLGLSYNVGNSYLSINSVNQGPPSSVTAVADQSGFGASAWEVGYSSNLDILNGQSFLFHIECTNVAGFAPLVNQTLTFLYTDATIFPSGTSLGNTIITQAPAPPASTRAFSQKGQELQNEITKVVGNQGVATLSSGTVTVPNTSVTLTSRIFLTPQDNFTVGALRVSARNAGSDFTITSNIGIDSGEVAYGIFEAV
jgi:hypothetical protein